MQKIVILPATYSLSTIIRKLTVLKIGRNSALDKFKDTEKYLSYEKFLKSGKDYKKETQAEYEPDKPFIMVYSSGTTGASKGIILTNDSINAIYSHFHSMADFPYERGETCLAMIPIWFSTGNVLSMLNPIAHGMTVILEPVFGEQNFINAVLKWKPNMAVVAKSLWLSLVRSGQCDKINFSFLKYPITGGERVLDEEEKYITEYLKKRGSVSPLLKGYGMCELCGSVTMSSVRHNKMGSVGYPIKGVNIGVFDDAFPVHTNGKQDDESLRSDIQGLKIFE